MLSNFSLYGKGDTLRLGCVKPKERLLENVDRTFDFMRNAQFTNCDFRRMFKTISLTETDKSGVLIYADPPYLGTVDNYSHGFTELDVIDLMDVLISTECLFAYSEFDHPFVIAEAEKRNLNIIIIGERQALKSRRTEILITNYTDQQLRLFA